MKTLSKFKQFVDEIIADNSRTAKLAVLDKYQDDADIKYYLNFIYNPYIITGISSKKMHKAVSHASDIFFDSVIECLEYVRTHSTGSDMTLSAVQQFIDENFVTDPTLESLFEAILTKNLPLGIDASTINKSIAGLIPEFNVQLANKYFDKPEYVQGKAFALTTKIDGGRIIALKENGVVKFYTRAGQMYDGLLDLEAELLSISEDNFCLDGELTLLDKGALTSGDQYKQTMKISRSKGEKHGLKMLVFDMLLASEFTSQSCHTPYIDRRKNLEALFSHNTFKYFAILPILYQGTDTSEIDKWLQYNVSHGEEGIMINILDAMYDFKRTNSLLKVKLMQSYDMEIIGFEEGTNKLAGTLGALLVRYKGGQTVKVGSGFSDIQRAEIWSHQADYLGTIVEVQFFEETTNAGGGSSLRFPVFRDFRPEKTSADF